LLSVFPLRFYALLYTKFRDFVPQKLPVSKKNQTTLKKPSTLKKAICYINRFSRLLQRLMVLLRVEALGGIFQRCKANVAQLRGFYELGLNHVVFFS